MARRNDELEIELEPRYARPAKPKRVREIEGEAILKGPCRLVGERTEEAESATTWVCDLDDGTAIVFQSWTNVEGRTRNYEIHLRPEEKRRLCTGRALGIIEPPT